MDRFDAVIKAYAEKYDIESLSSPNDVANLHTLVRNQIIIEDLQQAMSDFITEGKIGELKKINDSINDFITANLQLERQLGIDRKTRKGEQEQSPAEYIAWLKRTATEFVNRDEILLKVMCKDCKIMVGRISPVYDTTEYNAAFQCPQCKHFITVKRKEKDIFFDVKDADWRRRYPIEVVQPAKSKAPDLSAMDDDMVIE